MTDTKVSIVRAVDYDRDLIYKAVEQGLELIGGIDDIIKPGSKVFVKINHLPPASPAEHGIVTHPVFTEAVLELLKQTGADITVGDDIETGEIDGFEVSGTRQMCERAGVRLVNLKEGGFTEVPCRGVLLDEVYLSTIVKESDVVVNLPRLKTHALTIFTGGVKNMYGTIPGGLRSRYHGLYNGAEDFSRMLTDILSVIAPQLTIMDGIVAMEGEGPSSGKLRKLGVILSSRDTVALDAVATAITGLDPLEVHTTRFATERGLGTGDIAHIEVCGESIESIAITDFQYPVSISSVLVSRIPQFLLKYILDRVSLKPYVKRKKCTACRECEKICPSGAASVSDDRAEIDRALCIQCMCCYEVCRYDAVVLKRSFTGSLIQFLSNIMQSMWSRYRRK